MPENVRNKNILNLENRKHTKDPSYGVFHSDFFRHYATFLNFFGLHQRVSPSFVSILCNNECQKIPKGPLFYIFRHCDTVQRSHFKFFRKFSKISQGSVLLSICFIFCNQLEFHKAQKVASFTNLSLRYSADFGRSRLVFSQFHLP